MTNNNTSKTYMKKRTAVMLSVGICVPLFAVAQANEAPVVEVTEVPVVEAPATTEAPVVEAPVVTEAAPVATVAPVVTVAPVDESGFVAYVADDSQTNAQRSDPWAFILELEQIGDVRLGWNAASIQARFHENAAMWAPAVTGPIGKAHVDSWEICQDAWTKMVEVIEVGGYNYILAGYHRMENCENAMAAAAAASV